jgi:hypothetical protein
MNIIQKFKEFFTPSKVKELEEKVLQLEQKLPVLQKTGIDLMEEIENNKVEKLISKVLYNINTKNIDVILSNGNVLSGVVEKEIYNKIKDCNNELLIINLLSPPKEVKQLEIDFEKEVQEIIAPIVNILATNDNFEIEGDKVYLKGIKSIAIPSSIVAEFIRLQSEINEYSNWQNNAEANLYEQFEEEFNALLMFTLKLLLNPMENSRKDCLEYVKKYNIKLTNTGNMIMYRRIVSVNNSNKDLIDFVSKQYLKVKSWKKSPKNYEVFDDNGLVVIQGEKRHDYNNHKGNLAELYNNLSQLKENRYTDDYTRSYDIRIGEVYKIREVDIDINKHGSCGGALHIADGKVFNYNGFGDTPVVTLTDPRHVYKMDSGSNGKIGVKQMFIMAITEQDENGNYIDIDSQAVVNFDEIYHNQTIEELQNALQNKSFEPLSVGEEITNLTPKEVIDITKVLSERIVKV